MASEDLLCCSRVLEHVSVSLPWLPCFPNKMARFILNISCPRLGIIMGSIKKKILRYWGQLSGKVKTVEGKGKDTSEGINKC